MKAYISVASFRQNMYFFSTITISSLTETKNHLINYTLVNFYLCAFDCFFLTSTWDVMKENKGVNASSDPRLITCDGFSSLVCCFLVLKLLCGTFWTSPPVPNSRCSETRGRRVPHLKLGAWRRTCEWREIWEASAFCKHVQMTGIVDVLCITPSLTWDKNLWYL